MGKAQAQGLTTPIIGQEGKEGITAESLEAVDVNKRRVLNFSRYKWWLVIAILCFLALSGQSVATLLGRQYFDKGGNGKWMATLVQTAGFPVLLPFLCLYPTKNHCQTGKAPLSTLVALYLFLGTFFAAVCMLYTFGLAYLPVSTFSLICASQLAFIALFSYILNAQKFTPYIVNSLVLLTISSVLLVFQDDKQESSTISKKKFAIGFICTVAASAGYGFILSLTQLVFRKILKTKTIRVVFELSIGQSIVATCVILIGFFASGEWKSISGEMERYKLGKVSYVLTLVWTAVSWQVFFIGSVGLIFKVSALFANVISTFGLPIVPVFAVVFFHDKMNGVKVIAMLLSIWGFASYVYQHYLDDLKSKAEAKIVKNEVSLTERC